MKLRVREEKQSSVHRKRKKRRRESSSPLLNCVVDFYCTEKLDQIDSLRQETKYGTSSSLISSTNFKMTTAQCRWWLWLPIIFIITKQLSCDIAQSEAAAAGLFHHHQGKSDPLEKIPPAEFRDRPQAHVVIHEGQEVLFRCSLHKPMHSHMWLKNNMALFDPDMNLVDPVLAKRFAFQGDLKSNDFTIELRNARIEDTGIYRCQGYPEHLPGDDMTDFEVTSNLTVLPAPVMTLPPPTLASSSASDNEANNGDESEQQNDFTSSSSKIAKSLPSSVYVSAHQSYPSSPNNLIQAPQRPSMTRLPPPNRLLSGGQSGNGNGPSTSMNQLGSVAGIAIPAFWPYLLLALAALLMLVNIYLIYSLVMRHTRSRRSAGDETSNGTQESFENNTDSSVVVQFIK